jgi:hypothetical protein
LLPLLTHLTTLLLIRPVRAPLAPFGSLTAPLTPIGVLPLFLPLSPLLLFSLGVLVGLSLRNTNQVLCN